jgi:hypothetical protein
MRTSAIFIISIALFILVLIGVSIMSIITQIKQFTWIQPFAPLIVLTGFFLFLVSAGLFIYGIIRLIKNTA